jgi:hypothetical protein
MDAHPKRWIHKTLHYYMVAGTTTGIAGILYSVLALNGISRGLSPFSILFIVAATVQLFWIISLIMMGKDLV